jgi:hypothetical protein
MDLMVGCYKHIADVAPDLLVAIPSRRRKQRSVNVTLHNDTWIHNITGPASRSSVMPL